MGLLNSLAEAARWEVNLATEALFLVITKPVLEKGGAEELLAGSNQHKKESNILERRRAERVKPESCNRQQKRPQKKP